MKVFLAGETMMTGNDWGFTLLDHIERRLWSYYYHGFQIRNRLDRDVQESIDHKLDLFLDSGAYSAHTQGHVINLDKYAAFINEHGHHFGVKANLDDIGDTGKVSWDNLKALESNGCDVFPVFHAGDDFQYLTKMLDHGYEFMALGGLVGGGSRKLQEWLNDVWANYLTLPDGSPRLKVHGFGLTAFQIMFGYPWYSVDSASWVMAGTFGRCILRKPDNTFLQLVTSDDSPLARNFNGWHYKALPGPIQDEVAKWLEALGVTVEEVAGHYRYRHKVNAQTYQGIEDLGIARFKRTQRTLFT